jgi:hypothetical protein
MKRIVVYLCLATASFTLHCAQKKANIAAVTVLQQENWSESDAHKQARRKKIEINKKFQGQPFKVVGFNIFAPRRKCTGRLSPQGQVALTKQLLAIAHE